MTKLIKNTKKRFSKKAKGTSKIPRLSVSRSNKYIYVQAVDDEKMITLFGMSSKSLEGKKGKSKVELTEELGEKVADKLIKMGIKRVIFDRGRFRYHGRVKAVGEGARKGGLSI